MGFDQIFSGLQKFLYFTKLKLIPPDTGNEGLCRQCRRFLTGRQALSASGRNVYPVTERIPGIYRCGIKKNHLPNV